ncbi:GDSL-type esterase/lipase family protein [Nonomuraea rubra]|uniref:Lysophospholipase L1-like esterase n=1 Tax=Nonomuraea rubra TaxID=46180 RepID=A0A7X0P2P2_9ACTN|nr:GDSL-type esterase/lipase family protein [Nonomuraea rubra]MBB6553941.1 lysophospholipase L1-like esterase [Nonomuraea rubra]
MTTWAASAEGLGGRLRDVTVRNVVRTSVGGAGLRVRLTNAFGGRAVTFGRVCVGLSRAGAALEPGSNRGVTFGGCAGVTVGAGETVVSDPVAGWVDGWRRVAVSVYVAGECDTLTGRNRATAPPYPPFAAPPGAWEPAVSPAYRSLPGDHAGDEGDGAFVEPVAVWHWIDALTVVTPEPVRVVAAVGDSFTVGVGSETGHGWADLLAHLSGVPVLNEGVSGGKVLAAGTGRPAEVRLTAEVLTKPGIGTVIVQAGVNDLGAGARADDLVAAYRRMAAAAHAAGVRVIGGTITPFAGADYHTEQGERARQAVNAFIREGGAFDAVADFDAALRDPAAPARLLPRYDSGDHLHPSAAGHQAMASALDVRPDPPAGRL